MIFDPCGTDVSLHWYLKSSPGTDGATVAVAVARVKSEPERAGSSEVRKTAHKSQPV